MLVLDSHSDAPSLPLMWLLDPHIRDWSCTTLGGWRRWIVSRGQEGNGEMSTSSLPYLTWQPIVLFSRQKWKKLDVILDGELLRTVGKLRVN